MQISPVFNARLESTVDRVLRSGLNLGLAALVLLFGCNSLQTAAANGDTRTLSFHHTHTNEDLTITYKRDGRYDEEALRKLNWELRDWRRNEAVRMDPQVLDAVWELYRELGATQPIEIICGYRAPATNEMLRRRSSGVARSSQHTLGKAIDLHIPGVSLEAQRAAALRLHRGGVGYYPSSNFIHVDVGNIRHWPRMSYDQLARVFPDGRTVHVPSNGKPLSGYQLALADISKRGRTPSQTSLDATRTAGVDADDEEETTRPAKKTLSSAATRAEAKIAAASTTKPEQKAATRRSEASVKDEADKPIKMASADGSVSSPISSAPRTSATGDQTSGATPWPVRAETQTDRVPIDLALAYAADSQRPGSLAVRTAAVDTSIDRGRAGANSAERAPETDAVTVVKKVYARLTADKGAEPTVPTTKLRTTAPVKAGMEFDDPWLRAAMFAPSLYTSLTMSNYGEIDDAAVRPLMQKPATTIVMTFSDDPLNGLRCKQFTGGAVVFLATVTFRRTASLRMQ